MIGGLTLGFLAPRPGSLPLPQSTPQAPPDYLFFSPRIGQSDFCCLQLIPVTSVRGMAASAVGPYGSIRKALDFMTWLLVILGR